MWFNENYNSNSMPLPNISERIQMVEKESDLRVKSLDAAILHLDLEIMEENEHDLIDEEHRKGLRNITRELMNQMKIDRNLSKLILQEIAVAQKSTENMFNSDRFLRRFTNVSKELVEIQLQLLQMIKEFIAIKPGIVEKYFRVDN